MIKKFIFHLTVYSLCVFSPLTILHAQTLSSPLGSRGSNASSAAASSQKGAIPLGQGPGVHGANSPFSPLPERPDVVQWSVLTDVKTRVVRNRILPAFNAGQMALDQKIQRVHGFMMPLDPGQSQRHFLLSSVPLTCSFCIPGGPESMIEVRTKTPVRYSMEPVVVEGRFLVLADDASGLYYRMTDAVGIR